MSLLEQKWSRKKSPYLERRKGIARRCCQGRRCMIRFDQSGGDRRSGIARRNTDIGFRRSNDDGDINSPPH